MAILAVVELRALGRDFCGKNRIVVVAYRGLGPREPFLGASEVASPARDHGRGAERGRHGARLARAARGLERTLADGVSALDVAAACQQFGVTELRKQYGRR